MKRIPIEPVPDAHACERFGSVPVATISRRSLWSAWTFVTGSSRMSIEFGWWNKDDAGKYQVFVAIHGGNIEWKRKQGHHQPWEPHTPTDEDRERLVAEAERRVPRRLISTKQFEEIKRLSSQAEAGRIAGRRNRIAPEL